MLSGTSDYRYSWSWTNLVNGTFVSWHNWSVPQLLAYISIVGIDIMSVIVIELDIYISIVGSMSERDL